MLKKSKLKQLKITAILMIASFFILTYLLYINWNKITFNVYKSPNYLSTIGYEVVPIKHVPMNRINPIIKNKHFLNKSEEVQADEPVSLIDTPGCKIPVSMIDYKTVMKNNKKDSTTCGKRAVFLKKVGRDKVQVLIKPRIIKKYLRKSVIFDCCYRFISRIRMSKEEFAREKMDISLQANKSQIKFSKCVKFQDNAIITLDTDFVNVKCFDYDKRNNTHTIYDDVYAFTKGINVTKPLYDNCTEKYNVLMIGIDSMSLPRFVHTLKRTVNYLNTKFWLGFRGYHKVEDNTFPNLMAVLTGKDLPEIAEKCSGKMDQCRKLLIWDKFKNDGYVTAYGEDYLRLPDTFTKQYSFKTAPTDHYMRPLFLKGETEHNKTLVCAGKVSSGQQILNYALDFANTYKNEQFFGLFWMNSFSHNENSRPQNADVMIENFFKQLDNTGVMKNTFVIALSDHGIRFGEQRLKVESYYDERLPFLFISPPEKFRTNYAFKYKSLSENQHLLVTPYDLHHTLEEINDISTCKNAVSQVGKACPKCHSLFEVVSSNRTCQDVAIHNKWCSCHKLHSLPVLDSEGVNSVQTAVSHVNQVIKSVKTKRCWGCINLSLRNIIRMHYYRSKDKESIYYVVAFSMNPGNVSYEATIQLKEGKRTTIGSINLISPYAGFGTCTTVPKDRLFCVCQRIQNCWY